MQRLAACLSVLCFVTPLAHASDEATHPALVQILSPERGIWFNEGEAGQVGAVGRLVGEAPQAWRCEWYVDRDLLSSAPFLSDGMCATVFDVAALAPGTHALRMEARHAGTGALVARTLYFRINSAPEVVATPIQTCTGTGGKFEMDVVIHDLTYTFASGGIPARGDVVTVALGLWSDGAQVDYFELERVLDDDGEASMTFTVPVPYGATDGTVYSWNVSVTDADGATGGASGLDALHVETAASATYYDGAVYADGGAADLTTPVSDVVWSIESDSTYRTYPMFVSVPDAGPGDVSFGYAGPEGEDLSGTCASYAGDTYVCSLPTAAMMEGSYTVFTITSDTCSTADALVVDLYDDEAVVDNDRDGYAEHETDSVWNDCDDHDQTVYVGNGRVDSCDEVDDNCDGVLSDGAMDAADAAGGNDEVITATESGVTTSDGDGAFVIGEGNLHAPEDVDWWVFGVGEPGRGRSLGFEVVAEVYGDCATAAEWDVAVWATTDEEGHSGFPDYVSAAPLDATHVTDLGCDDSSGVARLDWYVYFSDGTDLAWWWAEVSTSTWTPTDCGDGGASTYTLSVID